MAEWRLFDEGTVPECTTAEWYLDRERAPHLEQAVHQPRLQVSATVAAQIVQAKGLRTLCDLGAGDGGLLSVLASGPVKLWGYDLSPEAVKGAEERGVDVRLADVVADLETLELGDICIATEFLEHLLDPHGFLARLAAAGPQWLVASSPWVETGDDHYEFHTWAWDQAGYATLLAGSGWVPAAMQLVGPFQVWLAGRR